MSTGFHCEACGLFIAYGAHHRCGGPMLRVAKALERIAAAMEAGGTPDDGAPVVPESGSGGAA